MAHNTERIKPPHPTIYVLFGIGMLFIIDWNQYLPKNPEESWLPRWVQVFFKNFMQAIDAQVGEKENHFYVLEFNNKLKA